MPLSGTFVIYRLGLAMINLHTKFELSVFLLQKFERQCKNWGGLED